MGSVNGRLIPIDELMVPVTDRGFLLGDGVFETLRTYGGRLFALEEHLDRLEASLKGIRMEAPPPRDEVREWAQATTAAARADGADDSEFVVRITVTRGQGPHGMSPKGSGPPQVYILARPLSPAPAALYEEGMRVVTARTRRVHPTAQDPTIKALSALNLILARAEADDAGADEALLCDENGRYLEASAANLLVLHDGEFWTPRGTDGVLEGVTMRHVIALLEREGHTLHRAPIPPDVLRAAEEVVLTFTTREVVPVVAVDGAAVGAGRPGAMARHLRRGFRKEVDDWLRRA